MGSPFTSAKNIFDGSRLVVLSFVISLYNNNNDDNNSYSIFCFFATLSSQSLSSNEDGVVNFIPVAFKTSPKCERSRAHSAQCGEMGLSLQGHPRIERLLLSFFTS